jgi:hypothetical protein
MRTGEDRTSATKRELWRMAIFLCLAYVATATIVYVASGSEMISATLRTPKPQKKAPRRKLRGY